MLIENLFELVIIGLALTYSNFARLPMLVLANILIFTLMNLGIESLYDTSLSPGYEIYYTVGGIYFILAAYLFHLPRIRIYTAISVIMLLQAIASGVMLITDEAWQIHDLVNDKALVLEAICVWLSALRSDGSKEVSR